MKLPRSTENKITEDKDGKKVPQLGITEAISVHCNIVNNDSPEDWKLLYLFVPNEFFDNLLEISPANIILLKAFSSDFLYIEVWFTDKNNQPLEIEDRINLALVTK